MDYRESKDLQAAIAAAAPSPIKYGFDAISEPQTISAVVDVLAAAGGGKMTFVIPEPEGYKPPASVTLDRTYVGTAHSTDSEFAAKWYRIIGGWLEDGKFEGNVPEVLPKGLESVPEGLKKVKEGVSSVKLVCAPRSFLVRSQRVLTTWVFLDRPYRRNARSRLKKQKLIYMQMH